MTEKDIFIKWMQVHENRATLPVIVYSKEIYDFIRNSADCLQTGGEEYYNVFGQWQLIKHKRHDD